MHHTNLRGRGYGWCHSYTDPAVRPYSYPSRLWPFADYRNRAYYGCRETEGVLPGLDTGYFRVAVESVITELYPMFAGMTPSDLWLSDNRIWESAIE
ncbi:unnamed protein product [Penicillium viridicatum]